MHDGEKLKISSIYLECTTRDAPFLAVIVRYCKVQGHANETVAAAARKAFTETSSSITVKRLKVIRMRCVLLRLKRTHHKNLFFEAIEVMPTKVDTQLNFKKIKFLKSFAQNEKFTI